MGGTLRQGKKLLFGGESSGTPMETRGATTSMANWYQDLIAGNFENNPFNRMSSEAAVNMLGFDPGAMGLTDVIPQLLRDPADMTSGLFASMVPFEQRMMEESTAGLRGSMGSMGGRFSRNLLDAETKMRGELSNQFASSREQALMQANQQRVDTVDALMRSLIGAHSVSGQNMGNLLGNASNFLRPGETVHTGGMLPGLISTAGTMWALGGMNKKQPTLGTPGPNSPAGWGGGISGGGTWTPKR
jgi:hypothetical protein